MKLTIIKDDNFVYVDGVARTVDCSSLPADFSALQWDDDEGGWVELIKPRRNETIQSIAAYQAYYDAWLLAEPPPPVPVLPTVITRRRCAKMMKQMALITGAEAVAMTRDGTPPAMVQAIFDTLTVEEQEDAAIDFAAATYYRNNPLLISLMTATGASSEDIDQFFVAASVL